MINWIRRKLGYHVHDWVFLEHFMSSSGWNKYYERPEAAVILGERMICRKCGKTREKWYPDGH